MRSFLLLLVGLLLAGVGQSAFALTYRYQDSVHSEYHVIERADCAGLGQHMADFRNQLAIVEHAGSVVVFFNSGSCTGQFREVGDVVSVVLRYFYSGAWASESVSLTLVSIGEDDALDRIDGVGLQRVLVMVGCALMFGIGMVVGKA